MSIVINEETIRSWENQLKVEQLTPMELERGYYFLSVLKDCVGHLVDFATLMLLKNNVELVRWSIKPMELTFEVVLDYARGKAISVYYDVDEVVKAGEF